MKPLLAIVNTFIDPPEAVRNMEGRFAWAWPLALASMISVGVNFVIGPAMVQLMRTNPPGNIPPERLEKVLEYTELMQKVSIVTSPLMLAAMFALTALLLFAACSVLDVKARFGQLFTIVCHCGLVLSLASIAMAIVVKMKGELQNIRELQPSFGPDMFLPEDASGVLVGVLKCFGLFHLWYYVVLVLAIAAMFKVTKGKAFGVALPVIFLMMLMSIIQGLFSNR